MKFKITLKNDSTYSEVGQTNPLRWKTLLKHKDGSFTDQSGWIKCKDFFNDTLAFFKRGTKFSIYRYKNDIEKNEEGVYFLLKEIKDMPSFMSGIDVLNVQLFKDTKSEIAYWPQTDTTVVILLPNPVWENTYCLSLVTMLIRCCNYGYLYKNWEDFYHSQAPMNTVEHAFTQTAKDKRKEWGFKLPANLSKYWWYFNFTYNSEKMPDASGGTIHNNGVCQWTQHLATGV